MRTNSSKYYNGDKYSQQSRLNWVSLKSIKKNELLAEVIVPTYIFYLATTSLSENLRIFHRLYEDANCRDSTAFLNFACIALLFGTMSTKSTPVVQKYVFADNWP